MADYPNFVNPPSRRRHYQRVSGGNRRNAVLRRTPILKPRLHDTTGCQTRCQNVSEYMLVVALCLVLELNFIKFDLPMWSSV